MNKTKFNFVIDIAAFIGFVVLTTTGVLMRYILPPGSGHYSTIWNLDRHDWGGIHFWISVIFFLILALHLMLHWRWIICVVTGRPREGSGFKVGLGIVGLATVIALTISPLLTPVEINSGQSESSSLSSHKYDDISIPGSMTLKEVEEATAVPASHIIKSLNLPESTSVNEKLSQLKQEYEFEINDVREIVKKHKSE